MKVFFSSKLVPFTATKRLADRYTMLVDGYTVGVGTTFAICTGLKSTSSPFRDAVSRTKTVGVVPSLDATHLQQRRHKQGTEDGKKTTKKSIALGHKEGKCI